MPVADQRTLARIACRRHKCQVAADLQTLVNGITFANPFLLASGPPGTNAKVIARSFDLGWGGVVCKTLSLDASKVINTSPRYAKRRDVEHADSVIGFENIELISDRPFAVWLDELRALKVRYPKHVLIASVMEEYRRESWHEIVERVQATGVDGLELNLSCPHGLPERKMGAAMGADPEVTREVCGWVMEVAKVPVWAKMTPNVSDPAASARAAAAGGIHGISAINTILSIAGVDLETLRPLPTVEGYSVPGGYSGKAVFPIALRHVMEIARALPKLSVSGMGGIYSGADAAQFIALGCHTVQVCTGAMLQGYEIIHQLKAGLLAVLEHHQLQSVEQLRGVALPYLTTHEHLVRAQAQAREPQAKDGRDADTWRGDIKADADKLSFN